MILEVSRRDMSGIVDKQALAVVLHSVAGQTESGSFGTSHFSGHAQKSAKDGQAENGDKGEDFSAPVSRYGWTSQKHSYECNIKKDQAENQSCRVKH